MEKKELEAKTTSISAGVEFVRSLLTERKTARRQITQTLLTVEEVLAKMINGSEEGGKITIEPAGRFGTLNIRITGQCEPFEISDIYEDMKNDDQEEEVNEAIKKLYDKLFGDTLQIKNSEGRTTAVITVKKSPYSSIVYTLAALVLGILSGLLIQTFLPASVGKDISTFFFTPVYTVFINCLKLVVAPLVFFSIASSIADFTDLKALGRIAVRIVIMYLLTSMIAICVAWLTYSIFPIGSPELSEAVSAESAASALEKAEGVTISIKDLLVGIVPTDIVTPFQKSDMLQIIFMAVILGLAAASVSAKMPEMKKSLIVLNSVFSKITTVMVGFIPVMVFFSMAKMMISMDIGSLLKVFVWTPVVYFADIIMIVVYLLLLLIFAGLAPHRFIEKYYPAMIAAFTFASSNAALPSSMRQCEKMGISPRIYSFSLPLGATINMDGSCISLLISALFCARIFQVPITPSVMTTLFIAIMVLSVGSPGVPGGNLVCIALLIPQIGVPAEAISLIMGLYPLVGMMQTCTNVTGDAVVTAIVAKREGLVDMKKFNS